MQMGAIDIGETAVVVGVHSSSVYGISYRVAELLLGEAGE